MRYSPNIDHVFFCHFDERSEEKSFRHFHWLLLNPWRFLSPVEMTKKQGQNDNTGCCSVMNDRINILRTDYNAAR